jgi:zinc protease
MDKGIRIARFIVGIGILALMTRELPAQGQPESQAKPPAAAKPTAPGHPASRSAAGSQSAKVFPYPVHQTTLPNGMKVVVIPFDSPGVVAYWTVVRAGSRDEIEAGRSGFAHFFEHMMFRGTDKYPHDKYNDILKELGADHNAFTTNDFTAYHILAPSSSLETLMTIESDRFTSLKYSEEEYKKEAGAVLGEYRKNASNPFQPLDERTRELAFMKHTYGHTTIGYLKDVEAMPEHYDYSLKFFDRFYRPEYATLLLVGDVKPAEAEAMARKYYGAWKRGSYVTHATPEPPQTREQRASIDWPSPTQTYLYVSYKTPAYNPESADTAALDLIGELLFSDSAPLYQKMVVEEQVVDYLGGGPTDRRDPSLFTWVARLKDDKDAARVEREVTTALEGLTKDLASAERLQRAKSHLRYAFALGLDTPGATARALAQAIALTGGVESINTAYARYEKTTAEEVRQAARRVFVPTARTFLTLSHGGQAPSAEPGSTVDKPVAAERVSPPLPDASTVLKLDAEAPLVAFRVQFRTGAADDPPGKEGLSALSALLTSDGGTKELTYRQVLERLDPMAASLSAQPDREVTTFVGTVHRDHAAAFAKLMTDLITAPRLDEADFTRIRDLLLASIRTNLRSSDDEELGKEALNALVFKGHPYGRPIEGTVEGLQHITLDDVRAYRQSHYTRATVTLGIAGGAPAALVADLKRTFGALPDGEAPKAEIPAPRRPEGMEVVLVDKPTPTAAISIGAPIALTRSDADFLPLMLANSYLGEHRTFNGRLMNLMRGARGLNYGDYSYVETFIQEGGGTFPLTNIPRHRQTFSIWIRPVAHENALFALREAVRETARLAKDGLTEEEFEETRKYLLNVSRLWMQTQSRRLGDLLDARFYGTPPLVERVQTGLAKLTRDEVNAAIRKYIDPENLCVAIVADKADDLQAALLSGDPSPITYQTPTTDPALLSEDKEIASWPLKVRKDRVTIVKAETIFEK